MLPIIFEGDCLDILSLMGSESVHTCVTSPPYFGLRDYGHAGQIGLETTPDEYVAKLVDVFREVRRVLRDDGTLWLNLGDSYARSGGSDKNIQSTGKCGNTLKTLDLLPDRKQTPSDGLKSKDLIGIPWRVAFALQADGWYLRQDIIWHKPNPMPEPVKDRCTKAHEYIFLFSKSPRYYFDADAIKEEAVGGTKGAASSFKRTQSKRGVGGVCPSSPTATHRDDRDDVRYDGPTRNKRDVWTVATKPYKEAHFATFPPDLIEPCVLAGCPVDGTVLDPFFGAGTTGVVAMKHNRKCIGIELNSEYVALARERAGNAKNL